MRFYQFMHLIFWPFKSVDYFRQYLRIVEQCSSHKNIQIIRLIYALNITNLFAAIRSLYLAFAPNISALNHVIFYDFVYEFIPKQIINLVLPLVALATIYFNYRLFFHPNQALNLLLNHFLIENKNCFFLKPNHKQKSAYKVTQMNFSVILNLFESCTLCGGKLSLF